MEETKLLLKNCPKEIRPIIKALKNRPHFTQEIGRMIDEIRVNEWDVYLCMGLEDFIMKLYYNGLTYDFCKNLIYYDKDNDYRKEKYF